MGYHFASQGIVTVVINYQLIPHVKYPDGAEDVQAVREWVFDNIASENYGWGSPGKVVLFGHSSGGAHIAMNLYSAGKLFSSQRGIIILLNISQEIHLYHRRTLFIHLLPASYISMSPSGSTQPIQDGSRRFKSTLDPRLRRSGRYNPGLYNQNEVFLD